MTTKPGGDAQSREKGLASELAVSDALALQSGGTIWAAKPSPDDHGVDRLAVRRSDGASISLQFKAAFTLGEFGIVEFAFDKDDVPEDHERYFGLCLPFVEDALRLPDRFWLVPSEELLRGGGRKGVNKLRIPFAAKRPGRWTPYLHPFSEFARVIDSELDRVAAGWAPGGGG